MAKAEQNARANSLTKECTGLFNIMKSSPPFQGRGVFLNKIILAHACVSAVIDIDRHIIFHDIKIADNHKRAAYLFAWISRFRPVKPENDHAELAIHELCANAYFALHCSLRYLKIDYEKLISSPEFNYIVYSSIYRDIQPEIWGIIFCLLEKQYPGQI